MATIRVVIHDTKQNVKFELSVPDNIIGSQLIETLISASKIPFKDDYGNTIVYKIIREWNRQRISLENISLKEAKILDGETLFLVPMMLAAGGSEIQARESQKKRNAVAPDIKSAEHFEESEEPTVRATTSQDESVGDFWDGSSDSLKKYRSDYVATQFKIAYRKFNIPKAMRVGISYNINLLITRLLENFAGLNDVKEIKITDRVKVTLIGKDFNIVAYFNEGQAYVPETGNAEWLWKVIPLKSGKRKLAVLISTTIKHETLGLTEQNFPLYEEEVEVSINPAYSMKEWSKNNWQWLIGTLIGSGVVWEIMKYIKPPKAG
jgi:hypothetical protein